ncbi:hypothetical protein [Mycolicibacterium phocaicum]|uniref:Uncharacterized protein n=1 Tax=Mycolicibacterium phocaicum TaxID=319706 RepID=A0A7I7ZLV4_9MYCO|nr:hypothetical protein [Mycolicibacterium phocaicum]TLH72353.1 hypothetical protein C1S79_05955 [Mycolicibacterium phocaicum]BBZ55236.1 hypothetical protein MPHO_22280 [Mycolicibacterium phocaicum]
MGDAIETTAQLIELADLLEVVFHELVASRVTEATARELTLRSEELHAPGDPECEAEVSFRTRVEDHSLAVGGRVETCNAYGSFVVDCEAVFAVPVPVSRNKPEIVREFVEQVGALVVFPYVRAAVASLASQISVPAPPLPLLRVGDVVLRPDEEPIVEEPPSDFYMRGTMSETSDDGSQVQLAEFFLDDDTGLVSRFGGEGETADLDELLNGIAALPHPDEITAKWMVHQYGEESARQSMEALRAAQGDAATDAALAEIDQAVAEIEAEDALVALNEAVEHLSDVLAVTRQFAGGNEAGEDVDAQRLPAALLAAAENVVDSWARINSMPHGAG